MQKYQADVAIVGAGIVGVMVANALQDEGRTVALFDRAGVAEGASFGNAGALAYPDFVPLASPGMMRKAPGWLLDPLGPLSVPVRHAPRLLPWLWRFFLASRPSSFAAAMQAQMGLMRLARTEMERVVDEAGLGSMIGSEGSLELYESDREASDAARSWEPRRRAGWNVRHVGREEVAKLQPGLSPRFVSGTFVPGWRTVSDPRDFTLAFADRVRARGGAFRTIGVQSIDPVTDGVVLTSADGSSFRAKQAVVAAGAWSKALARRLGDVVPLDTERGYNTTLPLKAFDLRRMLVFAGHGFVASPLSSGIRIGGAVELGGLSLPPNHERSALMLRKAKVFMPELDTEDGTRWMGFRPSMPDSLPVIGRCRATPHVVYAFGHGHLGLTQSAATGRLVSDLLSGRETTIPVGPFRPDRFRMIRRRPAAGGPPVLRG